MIQNSTMMVNPSKTLDDIPEPGLVFVRIFKSSAGKYHIDIDQSKYEEKNGDCFIDVYAEITVKKLDKSTYCIHSEATKGFGPLLYDIAMEFVTSMDASLVTGSCDPFAADMSYQPAYNVWNRYLSREDVERQPISGKILAQLKANMRKYREIRNPEPFMYSYKKIPHLLFSERVIYAYKRGKKLEHAVISPLASRYLYGALL